ncbi:MAG: RNA methyltransferase [Clostridia bacterium]|nr:RNA methyltransferase [Clostridia bacterium]
MISYITSRSNPNVVRCASLQEKKYREKYTSFLVEGVKLLEEAVLFSMEITDIFVLEEKKENFLPKIEELLGKESMEKTNVFLVSSPCFEKISTEKSPQGIITVIKCLDFFQSCIKINKESISKKDTVLILDSVRDPGNLGAVIRSAAAFSIGTVLLSEDCADITNPKTLRGAMGAVFKIRFIRVSDLAESIAYLCAENRRVFAAELKEGALPLSQVKPSLQDVFVIGNEGHGLQRCVSSSCTASVYIPICETTESLNASVAASILLWEQYKGSKL